MAISMYTCVHKIFQAKNDCHAKNYEEKRSLARQLRWRRVAEMRQVAEMRRLRTIMNHIKKNRVRPLKNSQKRCQSSEHNNRPSYRCHQCGITFKASLTLKMHIEQAHLHPYSQSSSESEFLPTEEDHTLLQSQCAACGALFEDGDIALRRHLVRVHLKLFECDVCGECHPSETSLKRHHLIIHRSRS